MKNCRNSSSAGMGKFRAMAEIPAAAHVPAAKAGFAGYLVLLLLCVYTYLNACVHRGIQFRTSKMRECI